MASLLFLQPPLTNLSSSATLLFLRNPHHIPTSTTSLKPKPLTFKPFTTSFSLAESDSPKSLQPQIRPLLQDLADSFELPPDYFAKLPNDLRLDVSSKFVAFLRYPVMFNFSEGVNFELRKCLNDCLWGYACVKLNDAAFDLSNGKIVDECGQELGETLLNLSRAWEVADTSTSHSLASKLPDLEESLTDNTKSALGKRLVSAGRRFQSMGQYGEGELQKIAKTMTTAGKLLSATSVSTASNEEPKNESRMLKFGELQLELTSEKATVGAIISFAFGILSWQLAQGVQNIPENSLQYANDNALLLAKSLRGALLAACYASAILSGFTTFGLILLGRQLKSPKEK